MAPTAKAPLVTTEAVVFCCTSLCRLNRLGALLAQTSLRVWMQPDLALVRRERVQRALRKHFRKEVGIACGNGLREHEAAVGRIRLPAHRKLLPVPPICVAHVRSADRWVDGWIPRVTKDGKRMPLATQAASASSFKDERVSHHFFLRAKYVPVPRRTTAPAMSPPHKR